VAAPEPLAGWAWLEAPGEAREPSSDLCRAAASCLGTADGRLLLRHLQRAFLDRRLPPSASDAELRHLEGQRSVAAHLMLLAERGRAAPPATPANLADPRDPR
jgi:hypothetical protein